MAADDDDDEDGNQDDDYDDDGFWPDTANSFAVGGVSCCNQAQQTFLLLYLVYWMVALASRNSLLAKPLRLLTTAVHEMSHALACWLTGGKVQQIQVYNSEGGVTRFQGGCRCIVTSAGYLGEAFWGMLAVVLSGGRKTAMAAAGGLVLALIIALCHNPNCVLVLVNLFYILLLSGMIYVEWNVFSPILTYVMLFFGVFFSTYAILDIFTHLVWKSPRQGSDAYTLYEESGRCCPPRCVGIWWLCSAINMQVMGLLIALILQSDDCQESSWFQCVFAQAKLVDLDFERWSSWWPPSNGWIINYDDDDDNVAEDEPDRAF